MEHTPAIGFVESGGRVTGVRTPRATSPRASSSSPPAPGPQAFGTVPDTFPTLSLVPAKGQMLLLRAAPGALRHMVLASGEYLVPRADGRILAGSTIEYVGFDTSVTARGVASIASAVARMGAASRRRAGRDVVGGACVPDTRDHLPILGENAPRPRRRDRPLPQRDHARAGDGRDRPRRDRRPHDARHHAVRAVARVTVPGFGETEIGARPPE
jgi:glycine oxidase